MAALDRFRSDDRRALEQFYRRVAGPEAAERLRLTWQWERRQNPAAREQVATPWIVREGTAIVGACDGMPVRLVMSGRDVSGTWITDPVVASERDRQGLHEMLIRAWHRDTEVTLAAGIAETTRV